LISMTQDVVTSSFQGIIYKVFQEGLAANPDHGIAIAFVAAHPGAGTTFLTTRLTDALQRGSVEPAVLLDCRSVATPYDDAFYVPNEKSQESDSETSASGLALPRGDWRANRSYRKQFLDMLRDRFSYILLDCPSLKESKDILGLTRLVDGFVLVVEANKTSKGQLAHLERTIGNAGGKILGSLLNKRTYPVPGWLA
jgi:hypothetical protein